MGVFHTLVLSVPGVAVDPDLNGEVIDGSEFGSVDLSGSNLVRVAVDADMLSLNVKVQASNDDGENWSNICEQTVLNTGSLSVSRWFAIPQSMKVADARFRALAFVLLGESLVRFVEVETR